MQASSLAGTNDAGFNPLYQMAYPIKIATSRWLGSRTVERPTQSEVVRSDVQNWSLTASWMERGPPMGTSCGRTNRLNETPYGRIENPEFGLAHIKLRAHSFCTSAKTPSSATLAHLMSGDRTPLFFQPKMLTPGSVYRNKNKLRRETHPGEH